MGRTPYQNGKELITVEWDAWEGTHVLALYKEQYVYSGGLALFMWDITDSEPWGDITINLPDKSLDLASNEICLNSFVDDDVLRALKGIVTPTGDEISYNYGTYQVAEVNMSIIDKLPNEDELMDMLYSE